MRQILLNFVNSKTHIFNDLFYVTICTFFLHLSFLLATQEYEIIIVENIFF